MFFPVKSTLDMYNCGVTAFLAAQHTTMYLYTLYQVNVTVVLRYMYSYNLPDWYNLTTVILYMYEYTVLYCLASDNTLISAVVHPEISSAVLR